MALHKSITERDVNGSFRHNTSIAVAAGVIVCLALLISYSFITDSIMRNSMQNVEELIKHDQRAIEASVQEKWRVLEGIGNYLMQQKCQTTEELMRKLSPNKNIINAIGLTLVADDGSNISSNMGRNTDNDLVQYCQEGKDCFIYNAASLSATTAEQGEELIAGVRITPFTVEDVTYTYIVARLDIDTLQDGLKIDCYNGRGYTSVIDSEGKFIVKVNRSYSLHQMEDFYAEIRMGHLEEGWTEEHIRSKISRNERFMLTFIREDGTDCMMSFVPMESTDWYFIMSVPKAVFREQSLSLVKIMLAFVVFVILIVLGVLLMLLHRNYRTLKMERQYRKELSDALVLADRANEAKTVFLNNMSHDIRTPMNAVIGYTKLAITHIDNTERVKEYLKKITKSSNHLLSLINDVLDMSRIEAGKVEIEEKPENLAEMLHGLHDIIAADIHSRNLKLSMSACQVTDEDILCDKLHFNQIMLNLLSNAMKYTPPDGMIFVRVVQNGVTKDGYGNYTFCVKDTGVGMSREFQKTIFEPFTREHSSTISGIQGTGLGMSITKNIVEMMNGTIAVESEKGIGTEFTVSIRFKLLQEHQSSHRLQEMDGMRGLVIDSNADTRRSTAWMLEQIGLQTDCAPDGTDALIRIADAQKANVAYKVYIIDSVRADSNAVELVRQIRQAADDTARIYLLSAYDWADIEQAARAAGVTGFISKPMFLSDLTAALQEMDAQREWKESGNTKEDEPPKVLSKYKNMRLLLVEDNEINQEIAIELLQEAGFVIMTAMNGVEAVEMVRNSKPGFYAAVLMDIQMPVMNGYDATRKIRALPDKALACVPIIAMTANAFEEDKKEAYAAGMNAHVEKPIHMEVLLSTLDRVLSAKDSL